jgi:hypothetical protein
MAPPTGRSRRAGRARPRRRRRCREVVGGVVPHGGPARADVETVAARELHGDGLHPGRVPRQARDVAADEVAVDVEVRVGEQAEVAVPAPVEVERAAVAADEARVLADRAWHVAICRRKRLLANGNSVLLQSTQST